MTEDILYIRTAKINPTFDITKIVKVHAQRSLIVFKEKMINHIKNDSSIPDKLLSEYIKCVHETKVEIVEIDDEIAIRIYTIFDDNDEIKKYEQNLSPNENIDSITKKIFSDSCKEAYRKSIPVDSTKISETPVLKK